MFKALYEYSSPLPEYLTFRAGDQFTVIKRANKDWLQAQNGLGQIGYVPEVYVKEVKASCDEVLKFIDWSIEAIHLQAANEGGGNYTHEQRSTLQKLVKHRSDLAQRLPAKAQLTRTQSEDVGATPRDKGETEPIARQHSEKRRAPPPPPVNNEVSQNASYKQEPPRPQLSPDVNSKQAKDEPFSPTSDANEHQPVTNGQTPDNSPSEQNTATQENHLAPAADDDDLPPPPVEENPPCVNSSHTVADVQEILKSVDLPEKIGPELLEQVRKNTGLSFDKSKVAVETVLGFVGFKVPVLEGVVDRMLNSLHFGRDISDEDMSSHDGQRLDVIFSELTACKDDSQQRSWALHEDEAIIQEYLQELISILENAKPSICRKVVSRDNYEILHSLVQYYQMETRAGLCLLLLKTFGALCALERQVVCQLLYSVLPLELAQWLTLHNEDVQRVSYTCLVLTMLFSTADEASTAVTDQLNESFFLHILRLIEEPPSEEFEDSAVDLLISFMLAFNLHLTAVDTNVVLRALASFGNPKVFTERVMVLLNRGEDPVKLFPFQPAGVNSVVKLFQDMYSDLTTADLLYTNDAKVLVDVILARLTNLGPADPVRSSFLLLCQKVLQNSSYVDHCHRLSEIHLSLRTICNEEADTPQDKTIALQILNANPDLFSHTS